MRNSYHTDRFSSFMRAAIGKVMVPFLLLSGGISFAGTTDLATTPMVTSDNAGVAVRPNLMFILDDSGSMDWDYLPDWSNDYFCKRASGSVRADSSTDDSYGVNSLCCRNRSGSSDSCMYGTSYASTGSTGRRMDVPMATSDFNSAYYNPAITYTPPKKGDGTSYASQTCTATGGTVSGTGCTGGWASVKLDAYGVQEANSTTLNLLTNYPDVEWCEFSDRTNCRKNTNYFYPNQTFRYFNATVSGPYYYLIIPGEYCNSNKLTNCVAATAPNTASGYTFPAPLRWCSDTALTTCQGIKNATYRYPRYPAIMASNSNTGSVTTVITISGSSTASNNKPLTVNSIDVATGPTLLSGASTSSNDVDTAAANVVAKIANGYSASPVTCSTSTGTRTCTFTVLAPASGTCPSGAITPTLTHGSGSTTMTVAASPQFTACRTPGEFVRINIDPSVDSYPYPGTAAKHKDRTDCAGTTCTYLEEMANFANWFTYYRSRMQMMKSAASIAFHGISDNFRVGYMSLNNAASNQFLNIATFDATQKSSWYTKLFAANPSGSTPLRSALSTAGLLYAGQMNGVSYRGSTVVDPVQYNCQKNFTLLSTDGYWNTGNDGYCSGRGGEGCKTDRTSAIGNADGSAVRPYTDGYVIQVTDSTPTTTTTQTTTERTQVDTSTRNKIDTTTTTKTGSAHYTRVRVQSVSGSCPAGQYRRRTRIYTYDPAFTETTTVTVTQPQSRTTTTVYDDVTTTTVTETRVVVTTNGVVTSDTTSTSTTGPTTVNNVTSGPSTTAWADTGGSSSATTGPNTPSAPPGTGSSSWGTAVYDVTACVGYNYTGDTTASGKPEAPLGSSCGGVASQPPCVVPPTTTLGAPAVSGPTTTYSGTSTTTVNTNGASSTVVTGPTVGTTTSTTTTSGGTSNSLADVAYYYYETDLRADGSLNSDSVDVGSGDPPDPETGVQANKVQRMVSYTLGLGIDGYMKYDPNYATASSGDFYDIANGLTSSSTRCTWQSSGTTCNWPAPSSDSQANIDDLWHAAVNGRGQYFSAENPAALSAGLSGALASISAKLGAAAAATTSNPNITTGDNFLFSSDFLTGEWVSRLQRLQIDPATGNIITEGSPPTPKVDWDAQPKLDAKVSALTDSRAIYTFTSDTGTYPSKLMPFQYANLGTTEKAYFDQAAISSMPQFCSTGTYTVTGDPTIRNCLTTTEQSDASGDKLVKFLRGQTGYEYEQTNIDAGRTPYYRNRTHVLGDIVSSEAVYVKTPLANYADTGFATFKASQASNNGVVYVAANDGMLHAFDARDGASGGGEELWAYVPTMAMPKMFNLASMNYTNNHQFMFDGTPVVDYAYFGGNWKTILVAGLGAGGAGYFALDVTNPTSPKALWEFKRRTSSCATSVEDAVGDTSDCDLGYSYGNPVITKLEDGTWVVLVTSGYNNTSPGDGKGYLYVLNPETGAIIRKISTGVGSNSAITGVCDTAPCPSGLAKIAAWVDSPDTDNTARRVYGGDLFGNLWRFDINDTLGGAGYEAQLIAELTGPSGARQPITARPELGESNGIPMVLIGTGRFLGDTDKADPLQASTPTNNKQSFYGIKDPLTATSWGNTRTAGLIQQTLTVDANQNRTVTTNSVDLATVPGWFIDLPDNGERVFTDPSLALGTVVFTSNVPTGNACSSSGQSFIYNLDFRNGTAVSGSGFAGRKLGNALATRPVVVQLQGGAIRSITRLGDTTTDVRDVSIGSASTSQRRVSWRQLINN